MLCRYVQIFNIMVEDARDQYLIDQSKASGSNA